MSGESCMMETCVFFNKRGQNNQWEKDKIGGVCSNGGKFWQGNLRKERRLLVGLRRRWDYDTKMGFNKM